MLRFGQKRARPTVITLADQARDQRQWERAAGYYREALRRRPQNPPIWVQYGHVLKESGHLAEAEKAYRTALACDSRNGDSYIQLGHVLKIQGKSKEARTAYLRALALDPSLTDVLSEFAQLGWSDAHISEFRGMLGASRDTRETARKPNDEDGLDRISVLEKVPLGGTTAFPPYDLWVARFDEISPRGREEIQRHIADGAFPRVRVLAYFGGGQHEVPERWLDRLEHQYFENWHAILCFHKDCGHDVIRRARARTRRHPRVSVVETPLSEIDRRTLIRLDGAGLILVASGKAILRDHAIYVFCAAAMENHEARLIYSDEDDIDADGNRSTPWFKPNFSAELLRHKSYLGDCALIEASGQDLSGLIDRLTTSGGVAPFLAMLARTLPSHTITRVPMILYHHSAGTRLPDVGQSAVQVTAETAAEVLPTVSIIIPTKDRIELLAPCLASLEQTCYPSEKIEIIVVDNNSSDPRTLRFLQAAEIAGWIRLLQDPGMFNYSRINNNAARAAQGDVLVFLNNDTTVHRDDWLRRLVSYAMQSDVGAVGAKLLYPDRTVQHGGIVLGYHGFAGHAHVRAGENDGCYQNLANTTHEVSAVTGACLAMRRTLFQEIGGFDEELAISFGDVLLCLEAVARGYRNIFIGEPLIIHHESKTRGYDDTAAKQALARREAMYGRARHPSLFKNDPYYSPNLSLDHAYDLAWPPRIKKPWRTFARANGAPIRVMMLSVTLEIGHGVAVVVHQQSVDLAKRGFEVYVAGPIRGKEFIYEGCRRVYLQDPRQAACVAFEQGIDCVVAHTPPFFSITRWLGDGTRSIIYDHGEPTPELFENVEYRAGLISEKRVCYAFADRVFTISRAVQKESEYPKARVIKHGNSHLAVWNAEAEARRVKVRTALGFADKVVVLNVCRFNREERLYKGVDAYADVCKELYSARRDLRHRVVFALCGKADGEDVSAAKALGLRVFANVSDAELIDLYIAADVYLNLSRWEGYNLGIAQALALGLPVIASDIEAHREFPIVTSDDPAEIVKCLQHIADDLIGGTTARARRPTVYSWDEPLTQLALEIEELCWQGPGSPVSG
jgi:GT2 family glycosyltransferase/tetratricopeptide (TPR) repeat protein